jgi:soluble lytic murein transglycosylase-like protein
VTEEVRTICDCQMHARRERSLWRRSFRFARRAAGSLKARGIAVLVSVPLALGALEFPTEAMHLAVTSAPPGLIAPPAKVQEVSSELPIFTTRSIREQFLRPEHEPRALTLDMVKEQFFRTNVPYGVIIYREARRHNLPPELVAAVVEAESDFRPRLISHKNAQGLMQIIPSTADFIGAGDLFNPADNIAAGTKYLRYLYDRFNGDQKMVLAAYNAGEGNVEKFGGIPPFPETINYLQRVNTRARHYRDRVRANFVSSVRIHNSLRAH